MAVEGFFSLAQGHQELQSELGLTKDSNGILKVQNWKVDKGLLLIMG
jgi:hypothetical protein